MQTRKRKNLDDLVRKARKLRWSPREKELEIMPISVKFNLFLFKQDKRKAFQIDGSYATHLKENLKIKYPTETDEQNMSRLTRFFSIITGFDDIILYDYVFGILVVREYTLMQTLKLSVEQFLKMNEIRKTELIGKLLEIPCTTNDWDLKNNNQIAIEVNNEDFIVYMCNEEDISKNSVIALKIFFMYRDEVENYNKTVQNDNNKIWSIWFGIRCRSADGGRYRTQTRKEKNEDDAFATFLQMMDD